MSFLPVLLNWGEDLKTPYYPFDQFFGLPLSSEDLSTYSFPDDTNILMLRPHRCFRRYQPYKRFTDRTSSGTSTIQADKNKFQVSLDVQQFAPEEMSVKVVGKNVVVEGKHEEKQDEHGWISRQFVRKYIVPEQCDIDQLKSSLSSDGILMITAPRKEIDPTSKNERIIKIQITGKPALRDDTKLIEKQKENQVQKNSIPQRGQEQTVKAA